MMYKPDDENLEQTNDATETIPENDITEIEAPIDPPTEEAVETPVEDQE